MAMVEDKLQQQAQTRLTHAEAAGYNATPASFWDSFYYQHENRFFKDRRWLHLEFPELIRTSREDVSNKFCLPGNAKAYLSSPLQLGY